MGACLFSSDGRRVTCGLQAAQVARAEQSAELAEFDENIPWDEREAEMKQSRDQELSRLEQELAMLEKEVRACCAVFVAYDCVVRVEYIVPR